MLPVLRELITQSISSKIPTSFHDVVFVCTQHFLSSSIDLIQSLISLGANPGHIFITTKNYSYHEDIATSLAYMGVNVIFDTSSTKFDSYFEQIDLMWANVECLIQKKSLRNLIILGDGGRCVDQIPEALLAACQVIAIEQTTFGMKKKHALKVPTIDVAKSAAKSEIEPFLIARIIYEKVAPYLKKENSVGVIGVGSIGKAVAQVFYDHGYTIKLFDTQLQRKYQIGHVQVLTSLKDLAKESDCLLGCSGFDVFENLEALPLLSDKLLISCSSENMEFYSVLKSIDHANARPFEDIYFSSEKVRNLKILNGGYPINFSSSPISVPNSEIQLTRGLLLAAAIQAKKLLDANKLLKPMHLMLDPEAQGMIVNSWKKHSLWLKEKQEILDQFSNIDWVVLKSQGYWPAHATRLKKLTPDESQHSLVQTANILGMAS